jgi:membrane-associated protease RseP (regulator of RpoE activity)
VFRATSTLSPVGVRLSRPREAVLDLEKVVSIVSPILALLMASWIALLFHELGHTAAAEAVGVRLWGVRLGIGPPIWRGTIKGHQFDIRLLPLLGGITLLDEDANIIGYRDMVAGQWRFEWGPEAWRAPIISAAGGLSNILGALLFITAWQMAGHPLPGSFTSDLMLFGVVANVVGYLNLLPCSRSDGHHLLVHLCAARARVSSADSA